MWSSKSRELSKLQLERKPPSSPWIWVRRVPLDPQPSTLNCGCATLGGRFSSLVAAQPRKERAAEDQRQQSSDMPPSVRITRLLYLRVTRADSPAIVKHVNLGA